MNRKGMIAFMDAMIFVTLITLVSLAILDFDTDEDDPIMLDASEICELILTTDMTDSDMIPEMGTIGYTMADAAAYATVNGSQTIMKEIDHMIDDLTMGNYGYCIRFTCNGHVESIGENIGVSGSSYSGTWTVTGEEILFVEMWLY